MFGATHIIVGAAIGAFCPNFWLAGLLGLLSHATLDAIPHEDYDFDHPSMPTLVARGAFDFGTGLALAALVFTLSPDKTNIAVGATFGALPDIIDIGFIYGPLHTNIFFTRIHQNIHWFLQNKKWRPNFAVSFSLQVTLIVAALAAWFFFKH